MSGLKTAKMLGRPGADGWAQTHDYEPSERGRRRKRGRLLAVMAVSGGEERAGVEQVKVGRELLARLHEEYFGKLKGSAFEALRGAVEKVSDEFSKGDGGKAELVVAVVLGEVVYLACANGGVVLLLRSGQMSLVLKASERETKMASGWLREGDVFVLATERFAEEFSAGEVKGVLENGLSEFVETLAPRLHGLSEAGTLGAMVWGYEIQEAGGGVRVLGKENVRERGGWVGKKDWGGGKRGLVGLIDGILQHLPERRLVVRSETVDMETKKRWQVAPLVGVVMLVVLGVSIFFGVKQRREKITRERYESRLTAAWHDYREAQSLVGLNAGRARELVVAARQVVEQLRAEGVEDPELAELEEEIGRNLGAIAGIYEQEAELYLDLTLVASEFGGDVLRMSGERMLVLDREGRRVVSVEVATKKTEVVGGPDYLRDAKDIALYAERSFVLSSDGIRELGDEVELIVKPEWDPGQVLIEAFAGNMYVLDKGEDVIWRYPGVRLGFAEKQNWLAPGIEPDFSEARSWVIDGMIWILRSDGRILKYSMGSPQSFTLSTAGQISLQFEQIYTDEESEGLYLLDRLNAKVLVFDKSGEYRNEYLAEKLAQASYFVVSEKERKMIFLAEDKLWEVSLRHLEQ